MATTNSKNDTYRFEAAFDQAKDQGEQFLAAARKAGNLYVDSYEKAVDRAIEVQLNLAGMTQQEWLKTLIETQADFTREVTQAYTTAARGLLK
jgi:hypothetical protein